MRALALVLAAFAAALPTPARSATADTVDLRRRPVAGEKLVHAFVLDQTLVAQRMMTKNGEDEQVSQDAIEIGGRMTVRFDDEIRAVDGARATLLRRVVEDAQVDVVMRLTPPGGKPRALELDGSSPLARCGVVHRWIPATKSYGKLYDALETSEEFLPRLATSIDLAGLLPEKPVEVGARWSIDPARLAEVFAYGGLVPIRFAKGADPLLARTTSLGVGGSLFEVFGGATTGTVEATLAGVDAGVARIALKVDVAAQRDQTALGQSKLTPTELYEGRVVENARIEWHFRGEGQLRWNVAAGRAESLALSGAEEVRLALALTSPAGRSGSDLSLAGGLKLSIDVAAAPQAPR